ncbi:MAG: response regulator [Deltaproteobacteria bacterium]|nr:response regulator [Deltaproteobacteria bacterium]
MVDKANILVVDDEMGPRESMKMILHPFYNVYAAESGSDAIELLGQNAIDLVTLDLKMPGLPGIKVLEKVKQHDPDIEAIIITGYGSMDTAVEGLRLGAFDYIAKPFDVNHILSLVKCALDRRNAKLKLRNLKTDFLANVSHELRTPLSVVVGFVHLLLDQVLGEVTEEQKKVLEKVYRNSEDLLELIDNVLWMTSLEAGDSSQINEEFDIGMIVPETIKRHEKVLQDKGLRLSIELPVEGVHVIGDRTKIERIFQNLFSNAVKFTLQGQITVKAHPSADGKKVEIEIIDTGIGIQKDQLDAIFEPFHQVDSSLKRPFSGLGLGLTVARRMIDLLGGVLEIESEPGVGTHVLLRLPSSSKALENVISDQRRYG